MSDNGKREVPKNFTDGQFFDAFKRFLEERYVGADGVPGLLSSDLVRPQKVAVVISGGARWTRFYINRAVYLWSADGRRIDYISGHHPGDVSASVPSPWNSSVTGVCKLFTAGEWHVKTPLIGADVENTKMNFMMSDAAAGVGVDVLASEIAGSIASGALTDIVKIGGVVQTGLDLTGALAPLVWGSAVDVPVGAGDVSILPANVLRRGFSIYNHSAGAQVIAVGVTNPMTAVLGIWTLNPGVGEVVGWKHPGFTRQGLRAWGSAAAGLLTVAEAL